MQTFLPLDSFTRSAAALDYRRLGKQRLEARTILNGGWPNHPASRMWIGYHEALKAYYNVILKEWIDRGYNNTMDFIPVSKIMMPWWFGREEFHSAHRATLLTKDPAYYSQFGWTEKPVYGYWWPTHHLKGANG